MRRIEFRAMGSRMMAALEADSPAAAGALEKVPLWFEEWEQALSRFRPDSELSRLNRSAGRPMEVSPTLWEVFHAARQAERLTGGLVTPTVLPALEQAGYVRSFELAPMNATGILGAPAAGLDLSTSIGWDAATRTLVLSASVRLDLGGIAKGWAAQRAMQRLADIGPALVDASGDIAVSGPQADGAPWPIGIDDPFHPGAQFETLALAGGGVATSGRDFHRWQRNGVQVHHIIDPRLGAPAVTDVLTATLVAPSAPEAEAAAKAVLILGSQAGMDWLEAQPGLAGVLVLDEGAAVYSSCMQAYLWRQA